MERTTKTECRRCNKKNELVYAYFSGIHPTNGPICYDCLKDQGNCKCEICENEMSLRLYEEHLARDHTEMLAYLVRKGQNTPSDVCVICGIDLSLPYLLHLKEHSPEDMASFLFLRMVDSREAGDLSPQMAF